MNCKKSLKGDDIMERAKTKRRRKIMVGKNSQKVKQGGSTVLHDDLIRRIRASKLNMVPAKTARFIRGLEEYQRRMPKNVRLHEGG